MLPVLVVLLSRSCWKTVCVQYVLMVDVALVVEILAAVGGWKRTVEVAVLVLGC